MKTVLNFEEISLVARISFKEKYRLEITLNYPPIAAYNRMTQQEQIQLYADHMRRLITSYGSGAHDVVDTDFCCEIGTMGKVHLHGYIECSSLGKPHMPSGCVQDLARIWMQMLPPRHRRYSTRDMYIDMERYKSPSIVCQYTDSEDRFEKWVGYISKNKK